MRGLMSFQWKKPDERNIGALRIQVPEDQSQPHNRPHELTKKAHQNNRSKADYNYITKVHIRLIKPILTSSTKQFANGDICSAGDDESRDGVEYCQREDARLTKSLHLIQSRPIHYHPHKG